VDANGEVYRRAKETVRGMYVQAADIDADLDRRGLVGHARRSEAQARIRAMITLTQSEPGIAVLSEELDADPWLLNVANGTLDLRTGALRSHQRVDLITKLTPIEYHPEATCPIWERFLERILPSSALRGFLQRALGYSLSGDTNERVIFIAYGTGANGKSTLMDTCRALLGEYAATTPAETFLAKREGTIPNDLARLKGARYVSAVETDAGRRLAEALVKQAAGGVDTIPARFMRAEWFEFRPEFKIWLATNHKPLIRGTDHAIWDRIRLIPFAVRIPDGEQDKKLPAKLRTELPGILAWATRGCLAWQQVGLDVPGEVQEATAAYRSEMDVLASFLEERCVREEGGRAGPTAIYKAFSAWCEATGERAFSQRELATRLEELGFSRGRSGATRWWNGLRVVEGAKE
jgi:putative DNA primase/helicase